MSSYLTHEAIEQRTKAFDAQIKEIREERAQVRAEHNEWKARREKKRASPQLDPDQIQKEFALENSKVTEALQQRAAKRQQLKVWLVLLSMIVALETGLLIWILVSGQPSIA